MNFGQMKDAIALKGKLSKMEKSLKKARLTADAQGGKIKIVVNGAGEVQEVEIDPSLLTPDKRKELQKGLGYAFNQAREAAARLSQEKLQELMQSLPPGMRDMLRGM